MNYHVGNNISVFTRSHVVSDLLDGCLEPSTSKRKGPGKPSQRAKLHVTLLANWVHLPYASPPPSTKEAKYPFHIISQEVLKTVKSHTKPVDSRLWNLKQTEKWEGKSFFFSNEISSGKCSPHFISIYLAKGYTEF